MGMFENKHVEDYWVKNLWKQPLFPFREEKASHRVGKLFITAESISEARLDRLEQEDIDNHVLTMTLSDIDEFISRRIQKYKDRKNRDRVLFPDDLLQYMVWKQM